MKLTPERFHSAEFSRTVYSALVTYDTKFEEVLEEDFWTNVGAKLCPRDRIEVTSEDGTWFAELFVVACAATWTKVSTLRFVELTEAKSTPTSAKADSYIVSWSGPHTRFRVVRKSDKAVMKDGIATRPEAVAWVAQHEAKPEVA